MNKVWPVDVRYVCSDLANILCMHFGLHSDTDDSDYMCLHQGKNYL